MKLKLFKICTLSISIFMILFNNISAERKKFHSKFTMNSAQDQSIKTVIFDLGNVLFTSSRNQQVKSLILLSLRHPSLMYTLFKNDIKKDLFDMLHQVPAHTTQSHMMMYHEGKQLPPIMTDWMIGRPNHEVMAKTLTYLATSQHTTQQKIVYSKIVQFLFQSTKFVEAMEPIENMTKLVHSLKTHGYKLYVLSNWDHESFPMLQAKHQDFFNLFDGIMISGVECIGKPNPEFYTMLLQRYNLNPKECVFIDDETTNIKAACDLGIHGILNSSIHSVYLQLKELGILHISEK